MKLAENPEALGLGEFLIAFDNEVLETMPLPLRDSVTLYPLTPTGSVIRMVDHSRGVVSWVRPTMQLNRHCFEAQHGSKTELRSCFVWVTF